MLVKILIKFKGRLVKKQTDMASQIRADIVDGVLAFGSRVTIDQLAVRYRTSHMPVREALRQLAGEGIVVTEPNRGARVRTIDADFVAALMDLRAGVEAHLARRAGECATDGEIAKLKAIQSRLEAHVAAKRYAAILAANLEFHNQINEMANSPDGAEIVDRHWLLIAALWRRYGYGEERFGGVTDDHRHLIMAFEARDGLAAELIMGAHVMKSKRMLIRQIEIAMQTSGDRMSPAKGQPEIAEP